MESKHIFVFSVFLNAKSTANDMSSVSKNFIFLLSFNISFILFQDGENSTIFFILELFMYFANSSKLYHLSVPHKNIVSIFSLSVLMACIVLSGVVDIASS
ncbi:MAG: hypothetical protein WCG25_04265 [bacterium]